MMAKVAERLLYRLKKQAGNYGVGQLVEPTGGTKEKLAEFEQFHPGLPERYDGPVDPRESIAQIDISPAMDFPSPKLVLLSQAEVRDLVGWTDEQLTAAMGAEPGVSNYPNHVNFPRGQRSFESDPYTQEVVKVSRIWASDGHTQPLDIWLANAKRIFPRHFETKR